MLSLQCLRPQQLCRRLAPVRNPWYSIPSAHTVQVLRSPLGYRMVATSREATSKRGGPHISSIFRLRTLRPERLEAVRQEVIDLSGKSTPNVPFLSGRKLKCAYGREIVACRRYRWARYPEGTRGFFYYHRPTEGPDLAAGVRFRICESAAEFKSGRDLLGMRGDVWGLKVLELVKHKEQKPFLALCRAEQLIDEALIADIEKLDIANVTRCYRYCLSDPFYLGLAQHKQCIRYATRAKVVSLTFPANAFQAATAVDFFPLTGSVKAQFELSSLPEHDKLGPTLVVRVLDIVDPIVQHPGYDGVAPVPVPGTLLQRILYGQLRVLAIPLQRQEMAEDLLALAKTTWG